MLPGHNAYGDRDSRPLLDGDSVFTGLNMAVEPDLLQPGQYAFARNISLRRRKPTTRAGVLALAWGQQSGGGEDTGPVWGALSYRNPLGDAFIIKARSANAEICDETGGCVEVPYAGGVTLSSEVTLVQCFNVVLMLRGAGLAPLAWVPPTDWVNPYAVGFTTISQTGSGGTQPIPSGAAFGVLFKNRLIVPFNRDELAASDVLNYTRYDPVLQQFKINAGDEQSVRGLAPAGRDSLLVFKDHSIYVLENFTGTLAAVTQDVIPVDLGLGARRTIVRYAKDILWLGPDLAYYSLSQALDNRLQGDERAFSDAVEPIMASIKPTLLDKAVAKIWNKTLYLALPIGTAATTANVILTYDFTVGAWVSVWTSAVFDIHDLLIYPYQGRERLVMVHEDGRLFLMEEGNEDNGLDIPMELISRGYTCGAEAVKSFTRGSAAISTWAPTYLIESGVDAGNV
jgi:hypothetical protein